MRAQLCSTVAALAAACGGGDGGDVETPAGPPLEPAADLAIVAQPGDDLWLLQPELIDAVQRGTGVTNLYVTAGEGGLSALRKRIIGLQAAYGALLRTATGAIVDTDDWACGDVAILDHHVTHCRAEAAKLSLIFLGYPDGGSDGSAPDSLLRLWEGKTDAVTSLGPIPSTYDQASLIETVAVLIDATAPTTLRTLEVAATHGRDHADHMLVGALAVLATARSTRDPALVAWRGDNIADAPANLAPAVADRSAAVLAYYEACASDCATCGEACATTDLDAERQRGPARSYPIAMRAGAGLLRTDAGCVSITDAGANATFAACATAPTWTLDRRGQLQASTGLCLRALFTGEIVAATCGAADPGDRFFLDDEGHLWSGLPPTPAADMALAHLDCLVNAGGRPRLALCGANRAPTWQLAP